MKQKLIVLALALLLIGAPAVIFAHSLDEEGNVDLGVENVGLLPTNPFYFVKELARGMRLVFITDPIAKLEYELKVVNDKAAELKQVSELEPLNRRNIERALSNYEGQVERLKAKLESLREISNNPNIERLLSALEDRATRHHKLFEILQEKHSELSSKLENLKNRLTDEVLERAKEKFGQKKKEAKEAAPKGVERQVIITDNGFSPKEITIKKGDTVVWVNRGQNPSWIASAIHPTHSLYPEKGGCIDSSFDACRNLTTGEIFKFTFNHPGSWKYHNHLNASLNGTVAVEE